MNIFNPYSYIGAGVVVAAIGGSLYYQSTQIHHYHKLYNNEHDKVVELQQKIATMTSSQNTQTKRTEETIKIVTATAPVVKVIQDMKKEPLPANCATPTIPDELVPYL